MTATDRCAGTGQPLDHLRRDRAGAPIDGVCQLCEKHLMATARGNAPAHVDAYKYAGYPTPKGPPA